MLPITMIERNTSRTLLIFRSIGVGTKRGYKLFTIASEDKIEEICDNRKYIYLRVFKKVHK